MARRKTKVEPVLVVLGGAEVQVIINTDYRKRAPSVYSYEADALFDLLFSHISTHTIDQFALGIHVAIEDRGVHIDYREFRNALSKALKDGSKRFQDCDCRPRYHPYDGEQ